MRPPRERPAGASAGIAIFECSERDLLSCQYNFTIYLLHRTEFFYRMIARRIFPETRIKSVHLAIASCIVLVALLLVAGCTTPSTQGNLTGFPAQTHVSTTKEKSVLFYQVTIPQPDNIHPDYLKMDSDIFNQGEVIEFYVVNEGSGSLACWRTIPSLQYHLYRQIGTWELQPEPESTGAYTDYGYYLQPGESTPIQQVSTADLVPGHYKIVTDCEISREFEIHAVPGASR